MQIHSTCNHTQYIKSDVICATRVQKIYGQFILQKDMNVYITRHCILQQNVHLRISLWFHVPSCIIVLKTI
jgi:hypothetical protein